jgi:polyhydroxybutyrate depolymerase
MDEQQQQMPRTLTLLIMLQFVLAASSCTQKESINMDVGEDHTFHHDGIDRTYKMYRPEKLAHNAPMVFVLHGMTSSSTWSYLAGFNDLADEHGFLAVYPQSHLKLIRLDGSDGKKDGKKGGKKADMSWLGDKADSCKEGESFTANGLEIVCKNGELTTSMARWNAENADHLFDGQSDVEFLTDLARSLQEEFNLNPDRTFVAGFSNGGYMSYTLMCQAGDTFKAAGVVAGLIDGNVFSNCTPNEPKPIIHIHGADDGMVPIAGNVDKGTGETLPGAQEIVEHFARLNDSVTTEQAQVTDNANLTIYKPESGGAEVHYYRIEGHDHVWPGGDTGAKKMKDESGINASRLIWEFFAGL